MACSNGPYRGVIGWACYFTDVGFHNCWFFAMRMMVRYEWMIVIADILSRKVDVSSQAILRIYTRRMKALWVWYKLVGILVDVCILVLLAVLEWFSEL